jgi:hypothetical protein
MKLSNFPISVAVVTLIYAVGALLVPEILLSQYGFAVNPASTLSMRFLGVQFALEGALAWFARNVADPSARRAILSAYLVGFALGTIVSLFGTLSGILGAFGWSAVGLDVLFTLGFRYFLFVKPSSV